MDQFTETETTTAPFYFHDLNPATEDVRRSVLRGLAREQKRLPSFLFYDATGSELFDQICELPEYYITRTEISILQEQKDRIAKLVADEVTVLELGSGSNRKIRALLQAVNADRYVPVDISREHLLTNALSVQQDFPQLEVHAVCADFTRELHLTGVLNGAQTLVFFPGSTIGNFSPPDAVGLLENVRPHLRHNGLMLIGVDLKKDTAVLHDAYNDSAGVTARFNLNILEHINQRLDASIDTEAFEHVAFYNRQMGRIEMHLRSVHEQTMEVAGERIELAAGETLHTENSYKYAPEEFLALAATAGYRGVDLLTDSQQQFGLFVLAAAA